MTICCGKLKGYGDSYDIFFVTNNAIVMLENDCGGVYRQRVL